MKKPVDQTRGYKVAESALAYIEEQNLTGHTPSAHELAEGISETYAVTQQALTVARKHILPDLGVTLCHNKNGYSLTHVWAANPDSPEVRDQVIFQTKHAATRLQHASNDIKTALSQMNKSTKLGKQVKEFSFECDYLATKATLFVEVLEEQEVVV